MQAYSYGGRPGSGGRAGTTQADREAQFAQWKATGAVPPGGIDFGQYYGSHGGGPSPRGGSGGFPGGYVSPTVGGPAPTHAGGMPTWAPGQPPQAQQASIPYASPPEMNWNLPHLKKLLQQLGISQPGQQSPGQPGQQAPPGWDFNSLGLGNFYAPQGMGDAQNQPYPTSTVGGMGGGYMPRPQPPVRYR